MIIDLFTITKYYEFYISAIEKLNSNHKTSELEYLKKNIIISKNIEKEIIETLSKLIHQNKSKLMNEINKEVKQINTMMVDYEEDESD